MISAKLLENFDAFAEHMAAHVREKAAKAGSTILYSHDGKLIEENPATGERRVLEEEETKVPA